MLGNPRQLRASLKLTLWLIDRYRISLPNVIGHAESLTSRTTASATRRGAARRTATGSTPTWSRTARRSRGSPARTTSPCRARAGLSRVVAS